MRPGVYFFKMLARRPNNSIKNEFYKNNRLQVWLPDTIYIDKRVNMYYI